MNERTTLQDLALGLAHRKGLTRREAEAFARAVFDVVADYVVAEGLVRVKGFGTFKLLTVESRESVDINTGERIVIEPHLRVSFTPHSAMRDAVNRPFAEFQTVMLNDATSTEDMEYVPQEELTPSVELQPDTINSNDNNGAPDGTEEEPPAEAESQVIETAPTANSADETADDMQQDNPSQPTATPVQGTVVNQTVEEMSVNAQYVEHRTIQKVVSTAIEEELARRRRVIISWGGIAAFILLALILMAGTFALGFYYASRISHQPVADTPVAVKPHSPKPVEANKPAPKPVADTQESPRSELTAKPAEENYAELYPQVEGGEYWITGTLEEHVMVAGDNLYALARKAYGDKELATYIIVYNAFPNPNNILLGETIKLPSLKKKESGK